LVKKIFQCEEQALNVTPIRKQNKRRENELLILQAAEKVFAEAGFGGATMQLIADVADLPKANVHYYFSTKEALYRQVVSNIFDIWLKAAEIIRKCFWALQRASAPTSTPKWKSVVRTLLAVKFGLPR